MAANGAVKNAAAVEGFTNLEGIVTTMTVGTVETAAAEAADEGGSNLEVVNKFSTDDIVGNAAANEAVDGDSNLVTPVELPAEAAAVGSAPTVIGPGGADDSNLNVVDKFSNDEAVGNAAADKTVVDSGFESVDDVVVELLAGTVESAAAGAAVVGISNLEAVEEVSSNDNVENLAPVDWDSSLDMIVETVVGVLLVNNVEKAADEAAVSGGSILNAADEFSIGEAVGSIAPDSAVNCGSKP